MQPLRARSGTGLGVAVIWMSLLVLIPLAAVVGHAFDSGWSGFWSSVSNREARYALVLTVVLAVVVGVINAVIGPLIAWVLVRDDFAGKGLLDLVVDIPFALPTIVAGLVMLALYGEQSPVGVHLFGTRVGILVALLFVTMPFTIRTVQPVLLDLDRDVEQAAASLGASPFTTFRRIVVPPLLPGIVSGAALSFARALGEYGSVVLISSNLPFKTEIASSLIFAKIQDADDPTVTMRQASALATVLLVLSAVVLVVLDLVQRRAARRG
ncbi:MAG: sulfate ABC transporter permease subunit CysT [Acidimicrobiaceae bacterium]|nr:sulfate ABC transporter permease subunit CysT [Acidimicrobiaceae bacterium]